ncbi:hypothetical protein EDF62_0925 [Leucobacter luti]|uniref:Uncharacterized protein n=1 Tax=Leucobacter luti TaxID=340320 RepID=A0A4R6S6S8_9MICO|nr:hypothetical protein [Leucobacter luti]TDP94506.1 hypothetical protein EDF62_0925 [Leucobacter luti]
MTGKQGGGLVLVLASLVCLTSCADAELQPSQQEEFPLSPYWGAILQTDEGLPGKALGEDSEYGDRVAGLSESMQKAYSDTLFGTIVEDAVSSGDGDSSEFSWKDAGCDGAAKQTMESQSGSVYEEGPTGLGLVRAFRSAGMRCIVAASI